MIDIEINEQGVLNLLLNMDSKKRVGLDNIPIEFLCINMPSGPLNTSLLSIGLQLLLAASHLPGNLQKLCLFIKVVTSWTAVTIDHFLQ